MIENILLSVHKFFYGHNNRYNYKQHNYIKWIVCNVMVIICVNMLCAYVKIKRCYGSVQKPKGIIADNIIVSFTSYPARIKNVWMVVDSLFRQKLLPSQIVLYLSEEDFPYKEDNLPQTLLKYCDERFKIVWVKENLMPHKKYYYAFQKYKDKYVITVDDDNYYRDDLIETLWNTHLKFPDSVCANTVTTIVSDDRMINCYEKWHHNKKTYNTSSYNKLAIGASGILYPPGHYRIAASSNKDAIFKTCLRADDLWLKCQEILFEIHVANGDYYCPAITLCGSQKSSLISYNSSGNSRGNDEQWKALNELWPLNETLLKLLEKEAQQVN